MKNVVRATGITAYLGNGGALEHGRPWPRMHDEALRPHEGPPHTGRGGEDQAVTDKDATMTDDEIAFRAAVNVLRDMLESRRMPSGLPLAPDAAARR